MREIMLTKEEIDAFQPHLDRMLNVLFDCVSDEERDGLHEFCRFIDRVLGPREESVSDS